jgi:teichuronic acid biosynthesis glycosyltransferase TuaG
MEIAAADSAPVISIVMPAYNCESTVDAAIGSVQLQTFDGWELIIVDDCSTDGTWRSLQHFSAVDPRIKIHRHARNLGVAAARNTALSACRARYIAFLDSDDCWLADKLQMQLDVMEREALSLSYTQYRTFRVSPDTPGPLIRPPASFTYEKLLRNTGIACSTVMIDTSRVGIPHFLSVRHEDFACWLSLLKRGASAGLVPRDLMRYRRSASSVSGNKLRSALWVWRIYRDVEKLWLPKSIWFFTCYAARALWKHRQPPQKM